MTFAAELRAGLVLPARSLSTALALAADDLSSGSSRRVTAEVPGKNGAVERAAVFQARH